MHIELMPTDRWERCTPPAHADHDAAYDENGQVDPAGWWFAVEWDIDDQVAHADHETADDRRRLGDTSTDAELAEIESEMEALAARVEGRTFATRQDLRDYLLGALKLPRSDF